MRTRSSSNLPGESSSNPTSSNPKRRKHRCSKQPFILEESPINTMADQRTIAELLRAPTKGYAEAILVLLILAEQFKLMHSLINMMTSDQFFGLEKDNPHDHIHWSNKITSTIKYKDVPNSAIKLMLFPFSLAGAARRWLEKDPHAWDRYKDLLRACPHHGFTELHQLDTFYNALNPADQDSLNSAADGNLLERRTKNVLTIIENKSKQTSDVTTAMTAILKQFQATLPPASVKAVEEIYVTYGSAHPYYQSVVNYNQGNFGYRPPSVANQIRPLGFAQLNVQNNQNRFSQPQGYNRGNNFNQDLSYQALIYQNQVGPLSELEKIKKMNEINMKAMQTQINNVKNKLRNEMKTSIQALMSNQTNELKNMRASFFQINAASTLGSGPLPSNTIAKMKAVILKKLPKKLGDPGKFLIPCGFTELKCKALANQADLVIVAYESDPRVPLILGRPFLQTARALFDVHGEEMILRDCDERLTLNMRHDTSSYSNQPQKESINMINIFNDSCEDYLEDFFATNHLNLPPPHNINPLSGSTTSFSPNHLLEEFVNELALITFPPGNDDLLFDIESDLKEIEYFLNHDPTNEMDYILKDSVDKGNLANPNDNIFDTIPKMFTDEHALDYSSPPLYDDYDDDLDEFESNNDDAYDDPIDSKGKKIKESKLLIDELDLPRSSDFLPSPEYDSFLFEDFSEVDALPSTDNEDKVFNP
nr:hypothetical protein [Tanacetum cinerariifolium]